MDLVAHLQSLLLSDDPDYAGFQVTARKEQHTLSGLSLARSHIPIRLSLALQDFWEQRAGASDVAVLLRQCIRTYGKRLKLPSVLWQQLVTNEGENRSGLRVTQSDPDGTVEIVADPWNPDWLTGASYIDVLEERRCSTPAIGDGTLFAMTGWTTYQSAAQKAAVSAFLFAPPGSTLLVNLPTGGGKSLCLLLPAWCKSQGGRIRGGTTLVIVPTVSLAMDQEAQSRRFFTRTINEAFTPQSQTSDTSEEKRTTIRRGLQQGTLPVLSLAPEALLHSELYQMCLDAAAAGTLQRLVIDEAHLVETWGANFRTEFQLLATYRKKLLEASGGQLRTLLLSATTSAQCGQLLQQLFSEEGHFSSIQSNQLRPELSYWFSTTRSVGEREWQVREALRYLPRPLILYTTRPDDAERWYSRLSRDGFRRLATFTGKTNADDRRHLMSAWSQNQLDVMVATSAFGLGVDKRDIRTVVHACLPENTDRFYQEVGRAGRDGCSAISLVCLAGDDTDTAFGMQSRARITPEKALERWQGMRQRATLDTTRGNMLLIDIDAPPRNQPEMLPGLRNQDWNWHTILLMQRAGLLMLQDPRSEIPMDHSDDDQEEDGELTTRLEVELLRSHLEDDLVFLDAITDTIEKEKEQIHTAVEELSSLIRNNASDKPSQCLALEFARLYPDTSLSCGGCPSCRQQGQPPYTDPEILTTDMEPMNSPVSYDLNQDIKQKLGTHGTLQVLWNEAREACSLDQLETLLLRLTGAGFQQHIFPQALISESATVERLLKQLAENYATTPHLLLPDTWVVASSSPPLYAVPTVVVYPFNNDQADCLYRTLQQRLSADVPRVNIIAPTLYLASEHGYFKDRVNGLFINIPLLSAFLQSTEEEDYF